LTPQAASGTVTLMTRQAAGLLLAFICGNATAGWVLVGGNEKIYSAYADKDSVRRTGDMVQMLGLYDFLMSEISVDGHPHESTVVLREYDCAAARVRLLAFVDYSGHMGAGTVVSKPAERPPGRWEPVVPGAVDEVFLKLACGR
jgi:hypothetical protein